MPPALIRTMPGLIDALRDAVVERQTTYAAIEEVADLSEGHVSVLLGSTGRKNLGPFTFAVLLRALGKAVVLVDDPAWDPRLADKLNGRSGHRDTWHDQKTGMPNRLSIHASDRLIPLLSSEMGKRGGKASAKKRNGKKHGPMRRRIATIAATKRWARVRKWNVKATKKVRRELGTSCA